MFLTKFKNQFNRQIFIQDVLAGLTTSFAAIALGAAFGIQSGRGAFSGMVAAAIIPIIASIFGGTKIQASGPTAPMTAVTVLIVGYAYTQFGQTQNAEGFITIVILLSGIIMALGGLFKLGKLINFVPNVVILGFMNGIAALIFLDQLKKLFGFGGVAMIGGTLWQNLLLAIVTFALILSFPLILKWLKVPSKIKIFIPATLLSIVLMTVIFILSKANLQTVNLESSVGGVGDLFNSVSNFLPKSELFTMDILLKALPFALQLSLLGYLDSLLTSLVIDKLTKTETAKNKELMAQGLANSVAAIFGGIPGAQATIRSVILIKEGAKTRLAGILVGVFAFICIFIFKDYISLVASAIFVGVLFKAGLDVFEKDFFKEYFAKKGYKNKMFNWQMFFVIYTTLVTVFADLNVAVFTGTALFFVMKYFLKIQDFTGETIGEED